MILSDRARELKSSPTLALVAKAKELTQEGHDVISLSVGEPDWDTYSAASEAGADAIRKGFTRYQPAAGMMELRRAIAQQTLRQLDLSYEAKEVVVGPGAKFVLYAAIQALINPGEKVIVPKPYWVSYPAFVELAGGECLYVDSSAETGYKMSPQGLEEAIGQGGKVLFLNSPSNPTGAVYSTQELSALAEVLRRHPGVFVISDDIYNQLIFDGSQVAPHLLQVAPDLKDRCLLVNGASKSYAMTGWRIGWGLGPQTLISALGNLASQATGASCSISQMATLAAIEKCDEDVAAKVAGLKERRDFAVELCQQIPGFEVMSPGGAFYLWVNIEKFLNSDKGRAYRDSKTFSQVLLEKSHVAVVPGEEFGMPGYLRLSFVVERTRLQEALTRTKDLITRS